MIEEKNIISPKRFNWKWIYIPLIVLTTLVILYFLLFFIRKNSAKDEFGNNIPQLDERITKTFTPSSGASFQYNTPTIVNDYIYIGTSTRVAPDWEASKVIDALHDNYFYKMDLDLNIVWQYDLYKVMVDGSATLDSQGNIYFVTMEYFANGDLTGKNGLLTQQELYSLTPDGKFRWKKVISHLEKEMWHHATINCAIGIDDTIYVADSKIYAFDTEGNVKWLYPEQSSLYFDGLRTAPIIDSLGSIYFISPSPVGDNGKEVNIYLYKFNSNGNLIWKSEMDNNILEPEGGTEDGGGGPETLIYSSPSFTKNGVYLYAPVGNTINKVSTDDGKIIWSFKPQGASGSFKENGAVDDKDNLYIGTKSNKDSKFYAIKADGSGYLWVRNIGSDMYASPLLGDDGKVYIGSEGGDEGTFHALDMKTGNTIWAIGRGKAIPDLSFGSPVLYKGYVYFGVFEVSMGNKAFFKVKVDAYNYLQNAAWPRFHGGNENTGRL